MTAATDSTTLARNRTYPTYAAMLAAHADTLGERTAFWFEDETWSFAQSLSRANRVAQGLMAEGLEPGARISFIGKNDSRYFDILGGCAISRHVLAPINWRLAPPEIVDLLMDFDIRMTFLTAEMAPLAEVIRRECPGVRRIIGIGTEIEGGPAFDDWLADQPDQALATCPEPDDILLQIHTSGTTGRPKGAMLTNRNVMALGAHVDAGDVGEWGHDDISLVPLPLFHSGGTCYALYSIYSGGGTYITREPHPDLIFEACRRQRITKAGFVPAVIQMILNHPDFDRTHFTSLRCVYYGGAPITAALLEQAMDEMGCGFHQLFGMTESSTAGTSLFPEDHDASRPELLKSCGRPQSDTQIRIVDGDRKELPQGETGEIALRTPCIMAGYHNRPEASAEAIVDGWYYTGDMGYLSAEGYLYIRDRLKDMIISGGENIYPAEIEQALAKHPDILESGAIGVPSEKWGEEVKACVTLRPGATLTEAEVIAHCRTLLAGYKCPKSVDFHDALPRNANGKILKRVLREPYWAGAARQVG